MANSKYVDTTSIIQVIGNIYNCPDILEMQDRYVVKDEDFVEEFHRILYGTMYKLNELGVGQISLETINDYLSTRPKYEAIYKNNKGEEWLLNAASCADASNFDFYYKRLKKFSLLRAYDNCGIDVSDIYDPDNILDSEKRQFQENKLDEYSLEEIADKIDAKIEKIKATYVDDCYGEASQAAQGIDLLIDSLKEHPEIGVPLYGSLINTVTRGARLRKFYLRSAATGIGKSRAMIADACYIACEKVYNKGVGWVCTASPPQPTLFITTEQDLSEVQTMMLAFLSDVNEEHILNGEYEEDEEERVREAAEFLKKAPLYIEEMPDFSLRDVEDKIKKNIREHNVLYVFFDYIHTSMEILEEITKRSGGVKLREDNVLFMMSTKLKDICNQYGVFIMSATQLNGEYQDSETPDQNLLRGAKSIADRIDYGSILLSVKDKDIASLADIMSKNIFEPPNIKMSIYKNRRGRYKGIYLWCKADLGTCRIRPLFATKYNYELIQMDDYKISTEEGAFDNGN